MATDFLAARCMNSAIPHALRKRICWTHEFGRSAGEGNMRGFGYGNCCDAGYGAGHNGIGYGCGGKGGGDIDYTGFGSGHLYEP